MFIVNERTRGGPLQRRTQGDFLQLLFPSPHEAAASRQQLLPKTCVSSIRRSSSPKVLDLDGCFSNEKSLTMIMVAVLSVDGVLSERALQLLLSFAVFPVFCSQKVKTQRVKTSEKTPDKKKLAEDLSEDFSEDRRYHFYIGF